MWIYQVLFPVNSKTKILGGKVIRFVCNLNVPLILVGTRKTYGESELKNTEFQNIQEHYWEKLLEERRRSAINRRKFQGMNV